MKRRSMLAVVGAAAGSAGCLGALPLDGVGGSERGMAVETDDPPSDLDISFVADVEDPPTADAPATLVVEMHNEAGGSGADVAQQVETGAEPPFSERVGESEAGDRLVLEPIHFEGTETLGEHVGGRCWRASDDYLSVLLDAAGLEDGAGDDETGGRGTEITLDAGGGVYLPYYLLAHPEADGCMPAGTYRFASSEYGAENRTWGFDLTIAESITADAGD